MDKKKNIAIVILIIVLIAILVIMVKLLVGDISISDIVENITSGTVEEKNIDISKLVVEYDEDDLDDTYNNAQTLDNNGDLTITKSGTYMLEGTINGTVVINTKDDEKVQLVLNNVTINSKDSACIYVKKASKVVITLPEGTKSTLTDVDNYLLEDEENEEPNATIFSKSDLTINGLGSLTINAKYADGIGCNDGLKIVNGNINITAADDGIRGKDYVGIQNGNITIEAESDGIKSTNDKDETVGFIKIEDGNINITTGGGSVNSSSTNKEWGTWNNRNQQQTTSTTEDSTSAKAIKAENGIIINNGTFNIDSSDDSLHSDGVIVINDGEITIKSGDDGIHADTKIEISGGKIDILKSYEGIESANITISNGEIKVVASDDGINVAGGNDSSSMNGRPGQNDFTQTTNSTETYLLKITGGTLYVNADGDGLDSNGAMEITGGNIYVDGPTNDGNGALDYDQTCNVTGGTLIAAGASGMMQTPSNTSTEYTISVVFSQTQKANSTVKIIDSKNNEIIAYTPTKTYNSIVITSPNIQKDNEYKVYADDTLVDSITITNVINSIGNSNSMNNPGNMGGQNRKQF